MGQIIDLMEKKKPGKEIFEGALFMCVQSADLRIHTQGYAQYNKKDII